jgi:hypothetical protein
MLWRIPADRHDQRIGVMSPTQAFSAHPRPVTSVSATKVSLWLPATLIGVSLAEIAEIPTRDRLSLRRRAAMVLGSQPNVQLAINGGDDGG